MPEIRPFRALRFDPTTVGDLADVVAPPYDVIGADEHARLLARHPSNVVRLDLPEDAQGDEPDDRYRRAARTLAGWRSGGVLRKDPHPSIYVYEQTYHVPGTSVERTQRGFFGRLRLEAFGPDSGVLPHERTLSGPKEDRYKLLRATGVNTSPVVGLIEDSEGSVAQALADWSAGAPEVDIVDGDGTRHRLWSVPADGDATESVGAVLAAAAAGPVAIADGHHRYEMALRYRDERRMSRSCEEDPAFDYLLTLFLPIDAPLTVLPTHRLVSGLDPAAIADLPSRAEALFDVETGVSADDLRSSFDAAGLAAGGAGRFGLWTTSGGTRLRARRDTFEPFLPEGSPAVQALDVVLLGVALERLLGIDARRRRRRCDRLYQVRVGRHRACRRRRRRGRVPARTHAGGLDHRGRPRRRRHAPEIHVLLSQGPDRSCHQPARVVSPLPDQTPDAILAQAQLPSINGRPVRKDEIELHDRGLYIEIVAARASLAAQTTPVPPWRTDRVVALGALPGVLRRAWLEGHALNLRNHHWSSTADPATLSFDTYTEDVVAALERLGPNVVVVGHGMGGLLALKAAERMPISGIVLLSPELPRELRPVARSYELREIPEVYGRSVIGWETLPERLLRDHRDLTLADVLRIQHLLGQKPHEAGAARRQMLGGVSVDRRGVEAVPRLVIGGGLDRTVTADDSERLAEWLDAEYEPFGAHSHYGLVIGESSYQQVADSIRGFLETHRL